MLYQIEVPNINCSWRNTYEYIEFVETTYTIIGIKYSERYYRIYFKVWVLF